MSLCVCVELEIQTCMDLCRLKNSSVYYFDQWSSFFYIFNTYCTVTYKPNIFYSISLKISSVMAFASMLKLISGLHKKSKLYSSVKQQQQSAKAEASVLLVNGLNK